MKVLAMYFILILVMVSLGANVFAQDSLNVTRVGFYDTPGVTHGIAIRDTLAYIAEYFDGLRIIDISDPTTPTEVGWLDTPGHAFSVAVSGDYAYIADFEGGLRVINVSNPAVPTETGFLNTPGMYASGVVVGGSFAFVAGGQGGLRVINITNAALPMEVGFYNTGGYAKGVAISGSYVYVANGTIGLQVINISNPALPTGEGLLPMPGYNAESVALSGNYAYVAGSNGGIRAINISNPASPVGVGFYDTPGSAYGVALSGNYAYVADCAGGFRVINITNPNALMEEGFYDFAINCAWGVAVSSSFAYVGENETGFGIYDISSFPSPPQVFYPNGAEALRILSTDTIRWTGVGIEGGVSIELNRYFQVDTWEIISDSTENDGEYEWFVTDPLSDACRIRICSLQGAFCDVSDGNFSIVSSQGYLALVRSSQPNSPLTSWDFGIVECPSGQEEFFKLKNFGSESIVVFQPLEPVTSEFSRTTACGVFFALAPNQISACSLRIVFDPASDGEYSDGLRIQTDAVNGVNGFVEIGLSGEQISTPAAPEVVITTAALDAHLSWSVVDTSVGGCAVSELWYAVFYSPTSGGPFYYHGWTADTAYTHTGVVNFSATQFYEVVAVEGPSAVAATLVRGMTMGEVVGALRPHPFTSFRAGP